MGLRKRECVCTTVTCYKAKNLEELKIMTKKISFVMLKIRIKDAVDAVTPDMISNVWEEFDYRIDICRVAGGWGVILNICNQISK